MRLRDMDIYQWAYIFTDPKVLFEKGDEQKEFNELVLQDVSENVLEPELTQDGLRTRQSLITATASLIAFLSLIFATIIIGIMHFNIFPFMFLFLIIPNSFVGSAMYIALFRGCRASLDEVRFKKEGKPKDFKINTKAHIRWYDFLMGIPFGVLSIMWIMQNVA